MTNECRQLAGLKVESSVRNKDARLSKLKRDEKMVQNVCNVLQDIKSPFETSTELFNISSGVVADKAVTTDILGAKKTGKDASEKFAEECLVKGVVELFDLITKNNLKSFGTMAKQVNTKLKNREISIKAERSPFARHIVMAQSRSFSMRDVLSFSGTFTLVNCSSRRIFGKHKQSEVVAVFRKRHASFGYRNNWCNMDNLQNGLT